VVKFLRRATSGSRSIDFDEIGPDLVENLKTIAGEDFDAEALVAAILRKFEILQTRDKKSRLLKSLSPLTEPWIPRVFLELLRDPSDDIRDMAARELAGREDCPLEGLYARLRQPPWYVKSAVLRILSAKKDLQAVPYIRDVIDDPNVDVRRAAALALGEIGGPEARYILVRLTKDKNPVVRTAAAEALDKIVELKFL